MTPSSAAEHGPAAAPPAGFAAVEVVSSSSRLKRGAKWAVRGLARIAVMPMYASLVVRYALFGEQAFRASSQLISLIPGFAGDYLRAEFYRLALPRVGADVQICFGTLLSSRQATIADRVYIGSQCVIGNADIGADVLLGSNVHLLSGQAQHGITDVERPIRLQPGHFQRISVGEDTWIGNGAIVMANVGRKCVIGAGSVVVSDIPELSIAAGNPARVVRSRR
jgi:acetyltransferase-like isoleucine patch superfamily enzyme